MQEFDIFIAVAMVTWSSKYYSGYSINVLPLCSFLQISQMQETVSRLHFPLQRTPQLFRTHLSHQLKKDMKQFVHVVHVSTVYYAVQSGSTFLCCR